MIKKLVKLLFPLSVQQKLREVISEYRNWNDQRLIRKAPERSIRVLDRLKKKDSYKVVFFMMVASSWKYDTVYKLMQSSNIFKPIVVVVPILSFGNEIQEKELSESDELCKRNGYEYLFTWNQENNTWIDIKRTIQPDIVFFNNPYSYSKPEYQIKYFLDCVTCYVPYSIRQERIFDIKFNKLLHNIVTRNYYESPLHFELAKKYARNKGENVVVTGFPAIDTIRFANPVNNAWKSQITRKKRIIWSPHWTIPDFQKTTLDWSSFLMYFEFMFELADEYKDKVQISFKPHPLLKHTLIKNEMWGKKRTVDYYNKWKELENGQLDESDYVSLFASSDALIHDCGSFMIEYLALNKPVLYLLNNTDIQNRFNDFGIEAFKCHYKAQNAAEIRNFIESIVLQSNDPLLSERKDFCENVLLFKESTASERIINDLKASLQISSK